jgi:hypothetical protein
MIKQIMILMLGLVPIVYAVSLLLCPIAYGYMNSTNSTKLFLPYLCAHELIPGEYCQPTNPCCSHECYGMFRCPDHYDYEWGCTGELLGPGHVEYRENQTS